MFKFFAAAGAALALSASALPAMAATLFTGGVSNVAAHNNGPGLLIETGAYNSFNLPLEVGVVSAPVGLFSIWTNEGSIDADDRVAKNIFVQLSFTSPNGPWAGGPIGGQTDGIWGILQGGVVRWNAPEIYTFGNGGQVKVTLQDTAFNWGLFGANPGQAFGGVVNAKFELLNAGTAVPEPATWAMMIAGFGMAGTAIRRRRSLVAAA